jgi:hypothetical protein
MRRVNGWIVLCALVAALVAPAALAAESAEPLMWLSWFKVNSGGQDTYLDAVQNTYGRTFDRLMKSGEVIGWGVAAKANHGPGPSHVMWITVGDWAGMNAVFEGIDADFEARDSGELKRLFAAMNEVSDAEAHFDWVVRHTVFNWDADSDTMPKYLMSGNWTAKPGADVLGLYNEYVLPINKDLKAKGVVHSFGMYEPVLHNGSGVTHVGWAFFTDLSQLDAEGKAYEKLQADPEFGQKFAEAFDFSTHQDYLWEVLHVGGMPAK